MFIFVIIVDFLFSLLIMKSLIF